MTSLTLYHDSQFSAFSTEVLARPNWGTIAVVLGAALDDITERKAAKHRSRANPTFDQRHDSELMHIRPNSRRRTLPKVFGVYENRLNNALGKKPLASRYAQNSDVATCQDASLLLGYGKKPGVVINKRQ